MDTNTHKAKPKYGRVLARVNSKSHGNLKPSYNVTRHTSTVNSGGKSSISNVTSGVFSELPLVLDDYVPVVKSPPKTVVVKPKRTLKSLEPIKPPSAAREVRDRSRNYRVPVSAPSFKNKESVGWSDAHVRQCYSSRSHSKLQELKNEIKAYKEKEDLLSFQSRLYKSCGVTLDSRGQAAEDKAVQAAESDSPLTNNSESTKIDQSSTTEVQTITSRPKTNAQRCREYREKKKLQNTMVQNINAERSDKCSETDQLQAKKPKTDAERRRKYYEAQKLKKQANKKIPKTIKQRKREYYYRKKRLQALNTLSQHSDAELRCSAAPVTPVDSLCEPRAEFEIIDIKEEIIQEQYQSPSVFNEIAERPKNILGVDFVYDPLPIKVEVTNDDEIEYDSENGVDTGTEEHILSTIQPPTPCYEVPVIDASVAMAVENACGPLPQCTDTSKDEYDSFGLWVADKIRNIKEVADRVKMILAVQELVSQNNG